MLTYAEPINRHVAFLTISGKDAAELSFRLYDTATGVEYYDAEESLNFVANASDDGDFRPGDFSDEFFVVKTGKVVRRAAATNNRDNFDFAMFV